MTKEKIIRGLQEIDSICGQSMDESSSWIGEVIHEAVRLLEQEPCEDCISRQAVRDTIFTECSGTKLDIDFAKVLLLQRAIKALPPVTPQPKIAYWIKYGIPRCGEQHYKCTSCGYYINFGQWGELYTKEFKYCPNCGAKMQAESDIKQGLNYADEDTLMPAT